MSAPPKETFEIEYSKSDRASCKTCSGGINKSAIRVGHGTPGRFHDGFEVSWHHLKCFGWALKDINVLKGWSALRWEDQMSLLKTYFPKADKHDTKERKKYLEDLYEIKDELQDVLNGPQAKLVYQANTVEGTECKIPQDRLVHILSDMLLLGRTGPCPSCKSLAVSYNSIQYKCNGYITGFTKCDWVGADIERFHINIPTGLKKNVQDYFSSFKFSKNYPKKKYDYTKEDDEEEEEENEEEDEAATNEDGADPTQSIDSVIDEDPNRAEDEVPTGLECFGMVVVVAGNAKNMDVAPTEIKDLVEKHGGSIVEQTNKATLMISCEDEVGKERPTKKVQDAIKSIPIFPTSWLVELTSRTGSGIKLRSNAVSKTMVIAPSKLADDYEMAAKYFKPKTTTTSTRSNSSSLKKRKNSEMVRAQPKKDPKPGSDILKVDEDVPYGYKIYVDHTEEYGYTAHNVMLNATDTTTGVNKYYKLQLCYNGKQFIVFMRWGRVGSSMGTKQENKSSFSAALNMFADKFKDCTGVDWDNRLYFKKLGGRYYMSALDDGWEDDETVELVNSTFKKNRSEESQAELERPLTVSEFPQRTADLVTLMFDPEMMKKQLESMNIDVEKMPLGKIKKSQIMEGYKVLNEVQDLLSNPKTAPIMYQDCSNRFYTLIPHNFGKSHPPLINTVDALTNKINMLKSLLDIEIATQLAKQTENAKGNIIENKYKTLKTKFIPMDKASEMYKMLVNYAHNSHDSSQFHFKLDVLDIFTVDREGERDRFENAGWRSNENKLLLWHGSRLTNWVGIISQGLRIAPPEAPKTGYRFGKGIYFADCVSKSASYCFTSRDSPTALMILCEVALGKMNELKHDTYMEKAPTGTHSTKALGMSAPDQKGNTKVEDDITIPIGKITRTGMSTSCTHNEFIVYDISQVKIKYILKVNVTN
ncbi:hypothetical protein SAMD00019534_015160 [Acytostelium subglobosum LB1]|uniref:hypothetical protein n=1 Tax=Acytostelium subglobosum LB1 TaxID=1410327 RepID=UPI0006449CA9|nr:hypothetical protein SAMD00019534_015160 [Acytostelium subglobosum LB1]GAM18341.1 hypothetical protein SAMD00019534_015160 [Acytostelium subglobosum LB1]|eukprot:XP_012757561.1 hypothetical protein SAMD00019534_015160 [Acytostelium subglobosum LB1]